MVKPFLDEEGKSNFGMLQNSRGGRGGKLASSAAMMMAFDLLYFDGHDIGMMELSSRRFFWNRFYEPSREPYVSRRSLTVMVAIYSRRRASMISKASSPRARTALIGQAALGIG
ncbi:hypothetical protein BN77_p10775 [Rhizobium mesoamericanum STM3625]|uniref:ATP-dependent DNA ligase family profile domain-containing protein n=1 Tax=Rhizobium mesoamericanum STM3625 TaxID=1211777 RepID=K0PRY7_9HYPH|nr:hypothetical protein BN77_p10775 [Rhizobium mesoamericanum STM3625]